MLACNFLYIPSKGSGCFQSRGHLVYLGLSLFRGGRLVFAYHQKRGHVLKRTRPMPKHVHILILELGSTWIPGGMTGARFGHCGFSVVTRFAALQGFFGPFISRAFRLGSVTQTLSSELTSSSAKSKDPRSLHLQLSASPRRFLFPM